MTDQLRFVADGPVTTLVIDNPDKRNAMNRAMWARLPVILAGIADDPGVRVLIVRGAPPGPFSAGADISEFPRIRSDVPTGRSYSGAVRVGQRALADLPFPTIAMVSGFCIGGGCGLAMSCDIRICDEDARFGVTPAKLGVVYSLPSTRRLVEAVGPAWAKQILFTGDLFDAATALRIGLVNEVCQPGELESHVGRLARRIAARAQGSVRGAKEITNRLLTGQVDDDPQLQERYDASYVSDDYVEGVRAFLEKRAPRFG